MSVAIAESKKPYGVRTLSKGMQKAAVVPARSSNKPNLIRDLASLISGSVGFGCCGERDQSVMELTEARTLSGNVNVTAEKLSRLPLTLCETEPRVVGVFNGK